MPRRELTRRQLADLIFDKAVWCWEVEHPEKQRLGPGLPFGACAALGRALGVSKSAASALLRGECLPSRFVYRKLGVTVEREYRYRFFAKD